ncbi:MAG: glycosyltransferase family 39 protein, partial [Xanthomonas perforans]|nr:glycosyltransferase family 39 protein [Xanthomonas perforans]
MLAITAVLVIGAGLGLRDPWPSDEPRFALVAKQMVMSGDWLFPHRGNELYSDKPPMLMWLQALFYTLLGNWRVAFLLPSLLAALGTLACVYDLGRRLWTRRVGAYAAWMLLFTLHFTFQAKKAQIDPLVVFWITLANYGLLRHLLLGPAWRWWTLGWFAAGLGVITKGVGIIALLMLIPAGIAAARGWPGVRVHVRDRRFWLGPLFFFVAILLWFVPMMVTALTAGQPEYRVYLNDILLRQTAKRYANSWDHAQPVWYHFKGMATMWLPTILVLPWAIPAWWRRLKRRDARYLLPLAWWLLVLVFFTIPSGKRDVYILPA